LTEIIRASLFLL